MVEQFSTLWCHRPLHVLANVLHFGMHSTAWDRFLIAIVEDSAHAVPLVSFLHSPADMICVSVTEMTHQLCALTRRLRGKDTLLYLEGLLWLPLALPWHFFLFSLFCDTSCFFFPLEVFEHHLQLLPCLISLVSLPLFVLFLCTFFVVDFFFFCRLTLAVTHIHDAEQIGET